MTESKQIHAQEPVITFTLELQLPTHCTECGFKNLRIHGHRTNNRTMAVVRCMRCGEKLFNIENDDRI